MFVTVNNFKKLYAVLHKFFKEKYGLNIDLLVDVIDVKRMMFDTMRKVASEMQSGSVTERNKVALKEVKDALLAVYKRLNEDAIQQQAMEQQRIMASKRALPDMPMVYDNDVELDFAAISQARTAEQEQMQMSINAPQFTQAPDNAFDDEEFRAKLQTMEAQRMGETPPQQMDVREMVIVVSGADRDISIHPTPYTFTTRVSIPKGSVIRLEEMVIPIHGRSPTPVVTVTIPELHLDNFLTALTLDRVAAGFAIYKPSGETNKSVQVPTTQCITFDVRDGSGGRFNQPSCDGKSVIEVVSHNTVTLSSVKGIRSGDVLRFGGVQQLEGSDFVVESIDANKVVLDVDQGLDVSMATSGWVMNASQQVYITMCVV